MHHFCTYFDINYLPRARVLHASLLEHCPEFRLHALCLDDACYKRLTALALPNVAAIPLTDLERANPALLQAKSNRNRLEYYYTCGPNVPLYVFRREPQADMATYLDTDLCFFSSPQPLLDAMAGHSVGVMPHRLPEFRRTIRQGVYNVGWISFRRDHNGLDCLHWWRDRCLDWCYERFEDGKYADQRYLDHWPTLFSGFYEYGHRGANVAPWNVCDYRLSLRGGQVFCDDDPLVFYHFHFLRQLSRHVFNTNLAPTFRPPHRILKHHVYLPYILRLLKHAETCDATASIRRRRARPPLVQWMRDACRAALGVALRQYVFVRNGRIY